MRLLGGKRAQGQDNQNDANLVPTLTGRKFAIRQPQNEIATMPPSTVALGVLTPILLDATDGKHHIFSVPSAIKNHTFYIRGNGAIATGSIQIRTASSPNYTGTFAPYGNAIPIPANAERVVNIPWALFHAIRIEVSSPIIGGTVSVYYKGD